jgi:hypothetical protein
VTKTTLWQIYTLSLSLSLCVKPEATGTVARNSEWLHNLPPSYILILYSISGMAIIPKLFPAAIYLHLWLSLRAKLRTHFLQGDTKLAPLYSHEAIAKYPPAQSRCWQTGRTRTPDAAWFSRAPQRPRYSAAQR